MADKKISQLDLVAQINNDAVIPMSQENGGEQTTYKALITALAAKIGEGTTFSNLNTTAKNLVGAINEIEAGGGGGGSSNANLAPDYDATSTYAVGDWCIYNGTLYQCNTAIPTAEAFNPTHWTAKKVVDAFADIEDELDDKVDTTDFLATNLPIQSGSATNTKDYIDGRTPIYKGGLATDLSTTGLSTGTYLYKYDNTTNGIPKAGTEGDCYITINNAQPYGCELACSDSGLYWRNKVNQVWGNWLDISGLLSVHSGISASPVDVNGTYQIPSNVLNHNVIVIVFRRFGYAASVVAMKSNILGGNYGSQFTRASVSGTMYWDSAISSSGLITLTGKGDTTVPYIEVFGYL